MPEGWDMVELEKPIAPKGAKGMSINEDDDPDYHPEPIDKLDPTVMELKQIEEYMDKFDKEVGELKEIQEKGTAKDYTRAKMRRQTELEEKFDQFEIEREVRLQKIRESREEKETWEEGEIEDPENQEELESPWDRPKPKKGVYPTLGSHGPGELNIEGDWEGPIELFEFEDIEEGWVNCTTGYYWHTVLGGGIC